MAPAIRKAIQLTLAAIMLLSVFAFPSAAQARAAIPVTGADDPTIASSRGDEKKSAEFISLADFMEAIKDDSGAIRGVYVPFKLAYRVVQQPQGDAAFVSSIAGVVTQFQMPDRYGNIGLLAHNFAAGATFSELIVGDVITIVSGDGTHRQYIVDQVFMYQALTPGSSTSDFIDQVSGEQLSASTLFKKVYQGEHHLTLQTCIQQGSELSWGRLFIIALPMKGGTID